MMYNKLKRIIKNLVGSFDPWAEELGFGGAEIWPELLQNQASKLKILTKAY
jgi:hypothetical protein